ncbi:hypothetical protein BH18ACT2_BH18ACT2_09660 [soil metagenome]
MRRRAIALLVAAVAAVVPAACDTGDGRELRPPTASERAAVPTTTSTTQVLPSLPLDAAVSAAPTVSTPPTVSTVPPATAATSPSLPATPTTEPGAFGLQAPWTTGGAIDARFTCDGAGLSPTLFWTAPPAGTVELALVVSDADAQGFVHWAAVGIPPTAGEVGEGATITGALEGVNDFGAPGWDGPCPPAPGETHTYRFALYALGQRTELPEGFTGDEVTAFAQAVAVGYTDTTGTYTRAG